MRNAGGFLCSPCIYFYNIITLSVHVCVALYTLVPVVQTGQLYSRLTACTKTALPCLHTCCALCSSTTCTVVRVWRLEPQLLITQSKSKTASHSVTHSPQSSASGQGTLDCRLHTCTPGTVSTHCKYLLTLAHTHHNPVCSYISKQEAMQLYS